MLNLQNYFPIKSHQKLFYDVEKLIKLLKGLVLKGHSVIVIEHNLEMLKQEINQISNENIEILKI